MDEAELDRARRVHYAFLPEHYEGEHLEISVTAVPQRGLGGDYCGIVPLPEGKVALTVSDATGHDLASALFAARINTDGLFDTRNRDGEQFGLERLQAFVVEHAGRTGAEFNDALFAAVRAHSAGVLTDDALRLSVVCRRVGP